MGTVSAGLTNDAPVLFHLGTLRLETVPAGAEVRSGDSSLLGTTPLAIADLPPQPVALRLTHKDYAALTLAADIIDDATNVVRTNLTSLRYLEAMEDARVAMTLDNFAVALDSIAVALVESPGDANALALQKEANERWQGAKQKANAELERQKAEQAKQEAERERQHQLTRPREAFNKLCADNPDANYFFENGFKTLKPAKTLAEAIAVSLQAKPHEFQILENSSPVPKTYVIRAREGFSLGILGGSERIALIVVGQTKDDETEVIYKVIEYQVQKSVAINGLDIGQSQRLLLVTPAAAQGNSLLELQLKNGVEMVTTKLRAPLEMP